MGEEDWAVAISLDGDIAYSFNIGFETHEEAKRIALRATNNPKYRGRVCEVGIVKIFESLAVKNGEIQSLPCSEVGDQNEKSKDQRPPSPSTL